MESRQRSSSGASDFKKIFPPHYQKYVPNDSLLQMIAKKLHLIYNEEMMVEIQAIGGNWCSDTQKGLPKLAKILDKLAFLNDSAHANLIYMRVSREKKWVDTLKTEIIEFQKNHISMTIGRVPWIRVIVYPSVGTSISNIQPNGTPTPNISKKGARLLGEIIEMPYPSWESNLLEILNTY